MPRRWRDFQPNLYFSRDMNREKIDRLIALAWEEDVGTGDITTSFVCPPEKSGRAVITAKSEGILAGAPVGERVFQYARSKTAPSAPLECQWLKSEGATFSPGDHIAELSGRVAAILVAERIALNFIGHLSGIATLTRKFVAAVAGTQAKILDTRKTTPGLRELEKHAVKTGGGVNHRLGLYDQIFVKGNHIRAAGGLPEVLEKLKATPVPKTSNALLPDLPVVEVRSLAELDQAVAGGAEWILFDNFSVADLQKAVNRVRSQSKKIYLEASGGVTLANVRAIAETEVDFISVGALTHSAPACDFSLEILPE